MRSEQLDPRCRADHQTQQYRGPPPPPPPPPPRHRTCSDETSPRKHPTPATSAKSPPAHRRRHLRLSRHRDGPVLTPPGRLDHRRRHAHRPWSSTPWQPRSAHGPPGRGGVPQRPRVPRRIQLVVATPWLRGGAMAYGPRQKQVGEYRGQIPSPGRPTVAWREDRVRFWASIATGVLTDEASEAAGVSAPVGYRWFRHAGGVNPPQSHPLTGIARLSNVISGTTAHRTAACVSRKSRRPSCRRSGGGRQVVAAGVTRPVS